MKPCPKCGSTVDYNESINGSTLRGRCDNCGNYVYDDLNDTGGISIRDMTAD
jgi:hypothetical protein